MTDFASKPRWDVFCKIVDNFGDIGVCWRLARQLYVEHGLEIRLWIDDLEAAQKIISSLSVAENSQVRDGISIEKWDETADFSQAADVVIETFSCGLPPAYLSAMVQNKSADFESKWINLEYLSAESWVADFHAKPSPQANGLMRYFYFPGFTEATGGLIREKNIVQINQTSTVRPEPVEGQKTLKISLFCYPNAPIKNLLTAMQANSHKVMVYVPATSILLQIADFFGVDLIDVGDYFTRGNLHVHILPFLSQADYDALLRDCDLNFVRGEDSWLRAIWAGKPFIWQPYMQDESAHMKKLEAFLDIFYANTNLKNMLCEVHRYWSAGQMPKDVWNEYLTYLPAISRHTLQQSQQLAKQADLATKLVVFCNKL